MKEKEQLIQLLVGLNDVYKGMRGNIFMSRPLPNVSGAYYMLLQEEHQREMSSETHINPQSVAFNSSVNVQDSLGLLGKNANYNREKNGGYAGDYNGNHNGSYNRNGQSGYGHPGFPTNNRN